MCPNIKSGAVPAQQQSGGVVEVTVAKVEQRSLCGVWTQTQKPQQLLPSEETPGGTGPGLKLDAQQIQREI